MACSCDPAEEMHEAGFLVCLRAYAAYSTTITPCYTHRWAIADGSGLIHEIFNALMPLLSRFDA